MGQGRLECASVLQPLVPRIPPRVLFVDAITRSPQIHHDLRPTTHHGAPQSTAVKFLKKRGVTKESLYASHRYSDNAANILKTAQVLVLYGA